MSTPKMVTESQFKELEKKVAILEQQIKTLQKELKEVNDKTPKMKAIN